MRGWVATRFIRSRYQRGALLRHLNLNPGFRHGRRALKRSEVILAVYVDDAARRDADRLCRNRLALDANVDAVEVERGLIEPGAGNSLLQALLGSNQLAEAHAPE